MSIKIKQCTVCYLATPPQPVPFVDPRPSMMISGPQNTLITVSLGLSQQVIILSTWNINNNNNNNNNNK